MNNPFERLTGLWREKLELARKDKKELFQNDADEAMRFYAKPHNFVFETGYGLRGGRFAFTKGSSPTFQITVNKVFELVSIMLPFFYHRNPVRQITPRKPCLDPSVMLALIPPQQLQAMAMQGIPPEIQQQMMMADPMTQQAMMQQIMDPGRLAQMLPQTQIQQSDMVRAKLLEYYLNYTPNEHDLKGESRQALIEAIVKGRGLLWPELVEGAGGRATVVSKYDTVDRLLIDPDAETLKDAGWVAREGDAPYWVLEEKYGLPAGRLKQYATDASNDQRSLESDKNRRATGKTCDTVHYTCVWSRIGPGGMLSGAGDDEAVQALEAVGRYVYLVFAENCPFPLNVSPEFIEKTQSEDELKSALMWPTPFHEDAAHPWPFAHLDFHLVPRSPWPQAHITPAMGYQIFLDWCYSFLAAKMRFTSRDFIVGPQNIDDDTLNTILNGPDLSYLGITQTHMDSYKGVLDFLQHKSMNRDIWDVLAAVQQEFEKCTGMTEIVYGMSSRQMRSAAEAQVKRDMVNIRPDDMAQMVENWMTLNSRMEGICARKHLRSSDVAPVYGEGAMLSEGPVPPYTCASLWDQLVASDDMGAIVSELEYRIEAGSTRKPNPDKDKQDIDESAQVMFPAFMQVYQGTGDPTQVNAWLKKWGKSRQYADVDEFMFPDMRQQMMAAQQQAQQPEGQESQEGPPQ